MQQRKNIVEVMTDFISFCFYMWTWMLHVTCEWVCVHVGAPLDGQQPNGGEIWWRLEEQVEVWVFLPLIIYLSL